VTKRLEKILRFWATYHAVMFLACKVAERRVKIVCAMREPRKPLAQGETWTRHY